MAAPTEQTIRHTKPYLPPAITGLTGLLDQHVRDRPDATALVVGGDGIPLSYGALAALADEVAVRLSCTGLRRGDAVGLISANTVEFVVALLGAAGAGLVVAPLDPGLPEPEMAERLERLGARVALVRPPAVDDGPTPRLPVPIGNCESALRPALPQRPPSRHRVVYAAPQTRPLGAEMTTPSSCSPPAPPVKRRWSHSRTRTWPRRCGESVGATSWAPMMRRSRSCRSFTVTGCLGCSSAHSPAEDACCCRSVDDSRHTPSGMTCEPHVRRGSPGSDHPSDSLQRSARDIQARTPFR